MYIQYHFAQPSSRPNQWVYDDERMCPEVRLEVLDPSSVPFQSQWAQQHALQQELQPATSVYSEVSILAGVAGRAS